MSTARLGPVVCLVALAATLVGCCGVPEGAPHYVHQSREVLSGFAEKSERLSREVQDRADMWSKTIATLQQQVDTLASSVASGDETKIKSASDTLTASLRVLTTHYGDPESDAQAAMRERTEAIANLGRIASELNTGLGVIDEYLSGLDERQRLLADSLARLNSLLGLEAR